MDKADVQTVCRLVDEVKPLLAGHSPAVQGAVLADLLAIWLGGHHAGGDTADLRDRLLEMHVSKVRELI